MIRHEPAVLLDHAELSSAIVRTQLSGCDPVQKLKRKFVFGQILTVVLGSFHKRGTRSVDRLECVGIPRRHDRKHLGNQAECDPASVNGLCHSVSNRSVSQRGTLALEASVSTLRVAVRRVGRHATLKRSLTAMLLFAAIASRV